VQAGACSEVAGRAPLRNPYCHTLIEGLSHQAFCNAARRVPPVECAEVVTVSGGSRFSILGGDDLEQGTLSAGKGWLVTCTSLMTAGNAEPAATESLTFGEHLKTLFLIFRASKAI